MQQVPQFIEIEDKIFGPFTFKQFVYIVGGAGLCFTLYTILPDFIAIVLMIPVALLSLALAFYKINNKPFIFTLAASLKYITGDKLYIWKKDQKNEKTRKRENNETKMQENNEATEMFAPKLSNSKLKDLAWSLGVKDSLYSESVDSKNKI